MLVKLTSYQLYLLKKILQFSEWVFAIILLHCTYRVFHRYGQAKFPDGGLVLGSSQFSNLPQLPLETSAQFKSGQN